MPIRQCQESGLPRGTDRRVQTHLRHRQWRGDTTTDLRVRLHARTNQTTQGRQRYLGDIRHQHPATDVLRRQLRRCAGYITHHQKSITMAEVLTHIDTLDVEVAGQEELDITVGSPMEHIRVLPITKNGKHVVSDYDLANVDVQPSLPDLIATENGTYLPKDYGANGFSKVEVNVAQEKAPIYATGVRYEGLLEYPNVDYIGLKSCAFMFNTCHSLTTVPFFDTSNVTNMERMFISCSNLTNVPLFNTSKVVYTIQMFQNCSSLISVPQFDTSKVVSMNGMFRGCSSLISVPQFDTSKVIFMVEVFNGCSQLTSIPLFDASKVSSLINTFTACSKLTNFGGLKNIGQSFTSAFTFDLSDSPLLTDESILNVLNGLYDMTGKGFSPTLAFHPTVKAKLTDEQIAIATTKNWNII